MRQLKDGTHVIGEVYTDTALVFIGDPCRLRPDPAREHPLANWDTFIERLHMREPVATMIDGCAAVSTNCADGAYPVSVTVEDGRVVGLAIDFAAWLDEPLT